MKRHLALWFLTASLALLSLLASVPALAADVSALLKAGDDAWLKRDDQAQLAKAVEAYEKALAVDGENYDVLWRLARAYEWQGKLAKKDKLALLEKGKACAEKALKVNERGADGHYWLGALIGRIGEARGILNSLFMVKPMKAEMDRVVELNPNYAAAHYVLSLLYWKVPGPPLSIGNKQKALEEAKLAVKLEPANTQHRLGLGEAYLALKDKAAAKREFQAVLAMPPTPDDPVQSALDREDAQNYLADLK
ncbi:MAG: tetratricopeptide repeat protein [Chitinophagales bacterium]